MIKRIFSLLILLSSLTLAQELSGVPGAFADIGMGARPSGLGGAYTALANDVHSMMWNPAGLVQLGHPQAAFTYTRQLGLLNYHYMAAAMPLEGQRSAGVAVISSGDELMREFTIQAGYAQTLLNDNLMVGVNLKFRYATFGNNTLNPADYDDVFEQDEISTGISNQVRGNAPGFGIDLGVLYRLNDRINLGLMLKDIYSPLFWDSRINNPDAKTKGEYTETVPFEPVFGTAFRLSDNIMLTSDYSASPLKDISDKFRFGAETRLLDVLSLRGGYQHNINHEQDEKYSLGLGIDRSISKNLRVFVDYSIQIEQLANSHRFSLGLEL